MSDEVSLKVNGTNYKGWISIEIKRSVRALSGTFSLTVFDNWSKKKKPWFMIPGDYCELFIGEELMISGYIDDLEYSVGSNAREITVSGRDKTGDLVDCSIDSKISQYKDISLNNLITKLAAPFGVKFSNQTSINPNIDKFTPNQGSSIHEAIDELSKKYGFIACSTPDGNLIIPSIGGESASDYLEEGINFLDGSLKFDHKERFSRYVLKGQANGNDEFFGEDASSPGSVSVDDGVKRYRPKVITSSTSSTEENLGKRAQWEKNLRASKSTAGTVNLKGWRQASGKLWKENIMVNYKSSYLGIDTQFLISDITYSLNESGRRVSLELIRKEVFLAELSLEKPAEKVADVSNFFKDVSSVKATAKAKTKISKTSAPKKDDPWAQLAKEFFNDRNS